MIIVVTRLSSSKHITPKLVGETSPNESTNVFITDGLHDSPRPIKVKI